MSKIKNFFVRVFSGKNMVQRNAEQIVRALEAIKMVVNNPGLNLVIALTKNKVDDAILKYIQLGLPKAIGTVKFVGSLNNCLAKDDLNEKINCLADVLQSLPITHRNKFYLDLAKSTLITILNEHKVVMDDDAITHIIEGHYHTLKAERELSM
jgi:hypothetical protein